MFGGASDANTNVVTYKVSTQQVATRAAVEAGQGVEANKLYYGVYEYIDEAWTLIEASSVLGTDEALAITAGTPLEVPIRLAKQKKYSVIFWAQSENAKPLCNVDWSNRQMSINNTDLLSNQESYDAFWACDTVQLNGAMSKSVDLKRPFAQLNIGTSDFAEAKTASVDVVSSAVTVKGLPTKLNLADGTVVEAHDTRAYALAEIPNATEYAFPVQPAKYQYLALNYVLVGTEKSIIDVELSYKDSENQEYSSTFTAVPVKRNYRTNIYGTLLTNDANYTVDINAGWSTPDENIEIVEVGTAADLQEVIDNLNDPNNESDSLTIVLTDDIDLSDLFGGSNAPARTRATATQSVTLLAGRSLTLDLNGFSISGVDDTEKNYGLIQNNGNLTINDSKDSGKLSLKATINSGWNRYSAVISNNPGATLTINGGTLEHLGGTDMAYGIDNLTNGGIGDVYCTINGGTVKSTYRAVRQFLNSDSKKNELIINGGVIEGANKSIFFHDPSTKANNGKLIVADNAQLNGNVYLFVTEGSSEWPVTVSIAKAALQGESTVDSKNVPYNYSVVEGEDTWTVEEYFTFGAFVEAVIAAEGTYDGKGVEVKIKPASGQADNTNSCLVPNRLQKYSNPEVYYAQYQRFANLENISISNVTFTFIPAAVTVKDAWNSNGATTTEENINGELQFMNTGSVTLTNCTFNKVAVSPINAPALSVTGCEFNDLKAYAIKDVKATAVTISDNEFNNCNGGFWFNAAPAKLVVTGNTFTGVGRRGAMQFSADGDYTKTEMTVTGNNVEGAFLWQLNKTVSYAQLNAILNEGNNTYTQAYTDNSIKHVAKIGEVGYFTLQEAVNAVEDGGTITLIADETFTENNRYNNGGYWDGLVYNGDKSFTIDLGGYTISQDGSLNDYLMWIKNDGSKDNTITLKNGTLDAGTTAYSAFATASSNAKKITINLEEINLINNISNGAVVKARGGSELNVKAGTIITALDSYVGIEAVGNNTVVNIFDGAEIYQKGTSSYVGAIVGASYNATMNIYGGYGKSAKCGIIVMSTGATINVSGGEWIANNDGTVAGGNQGVLVSQNNRYEKGWACKSVMNVTGGTFKGGYDCWGSGPGAEPDDAQININGGNFNADPNQYVVDGKASVKNADGTWGIIDAATPKTEEELKTALASDGHIILGDDITLTETAVIEGKNITIDLNGKTVTAELTSAFTAKEGANLTLKNGTVTAYESVVRAIGGKVTVESGEYTSTGTALDSPATYRYSIDSREGGEIVINGGTFKSNNGMINVSSTVTINGGKFENIVEKSTTRHFAYVSAPLTINDGEFYGKANSSAGGCFFCGAAASGDIQVKGGKFTSLWTSGSVNKIFESYYGGTINVTGGMFNTNGGIASFVTENTDENTKAEYPYVAK